MVRSYRSDDDHAPGRRRRRASNRRSVSFALATHPAAVAAVASGWVRQRAANLVRPLRPARIRGGSRPGCEVVDPFACAGTTALATAGLGRLAALIELSPEYAGIARERCSGRIGPGP